MSKAKMLAAKELILEKKYAEARKILEGIDHPTARKWLEKLEKLDNFAPVPTKVGIAIDWTLVNQEAYDFSRTYGYDQIAGLDQTTIKQIQTIISEWVASGEPQDSLATNLQEILKDPEFAALIAQTESTRVYFEGARLKWLAAGVTKAIWKTGNDNEVCETCKALNNTIGSLDKGWLLDGTYYNPPAHSDCRCYAKPVME
jgi:SPP1 gp7 family putative phage head morphogenesis protein